MWRVCGRRLMRGDLHKAEFERGLESEEASLACDVAMV